MPAHRVADEMDRLANRRLDPLDEKRRDFLESERQIATPQKQSIASEADQVERDYAKLARQRIDVMTPPVRRSAETVDEDDRRSGSRFMNPEREWRDVDEVALHGLPVASSRWPALRRQPGTGNRQLPRHAPFFDHQTAILHDLDAGLSEAAGGVFVADAELEPHALGFDRQDLGDVLIDVPGAPEDVDHVDRPADLRQLPINLFPQDFSNFRVINGYG